MKSEVEGSIQFSRYTTFASILKVVISLLDMVLFFMGTKIK